MRTFSKAYGLLVSELAMQLVHEEVIGKLDPTREPFNNTVLSQEVAIIGLEDQAFIRCM